MWFAQQRAKGASMNSVSGPLLQEKALALFPSLYPDEEWTSFKASSGWLQKFCRRHGIPFERIRLNGISTFPTDLERTNGLLLL